MNKKIIIISVAMLAVVTFAGCGNKATQEDIEAQQQEIDEMKETMEQEKKDIQKTTEEITQESCLQSLDALQSQQKLLEEYEKTLVELEKKAQKSPEFAIETCRDINPGLSRPECEQKVEDFMGGKSEELEITQEKLETTEVKVQELEAQCGSGEVVDSSGNTVTPGCQTWFDGCNTCKVTEPGTPMACTKKACAAKGEAKCMDATTEATTEGTMN